MPLLTVHGVQVAHLVQPQQQRKMKYNGVSYNGEHLSSLSFKAFEVEVMHHFDANGKGKIKELYTLIKAKYKPPISEKSTT